MVRNKAIKADHRTGVLIIRLPQTIELQVECWAMECLETGIRLKKGRGE